MSTIMEHSKLLRLYISISINIDIQLFEGFNNLNLCCSISEIEKKKKKTRKEKQKDRQYSVHFEQHFTLHNSPSTIVGPVL